MLLTYIIPTKTDEYVQALLASLRLYPGERVILADDGLSGDYATADGTISQIKCEKPFIFSRNVNAAIKLAHPESHIAILNDDTVCETSDTGPTLAYLIDKYPDVGLWSATINENGVGNKEQGHQTMAKNGNPECFYPTTDLGICFVAVFITRECLNTVGMLDERFCHYGEEDVDYTWRVREEGFKTAVTSTIQFLHRSRVGNHGGTFRKLPDYPSMGAKSRALLKEKWPQKFPP